MDNFNLLREFSFDHDFEKNSSPFVVAGPFSCLRPNVEQQQTFRASHQRLHGRFLEHRRRTSAHVEGAGIGFRFPERDVAGDAQL
jgi:hypothetical protein